MRWHDEESLREHNYSMMIDKNMSEDYDDARERLSGVIRGVLFESFLSVFLWAYNEDEVETRIICDELGLTKRHIHALEGKRWEYEQEFDIDNTPEAS